MSIILKAAPARISPAYNPVTWIFDSTNVNKKNFRYIIEVFDTLTTERLAQYLVSPEFETGFGRVDLSRLLRNYVGPLFNPLATSQQTNSLSHFDYNIAIGETFNQTHLIYGATLEVNGQLNFQITSNPFIINDSILIEGTSSPNVDGFYVVLAQAGDSIRVNRFPANAPTVTGATASYATGSKQFNPALAEYIENTTINTAEPHSTFNSYLTTKYDLGKTLVTSLAKTSQAFQITTEQPFWINVFSNGDQGKLIFENSNGDKFSKTIPDEKMSLVSVGTGSTNTGLVVETGTLPLVKPDTTFYEVYYQSFSGAINNKIKFEIDRRCKINEYYLAFLDRAGSFPTFAMQLRSYDRRSVEKESFRQRVEGFIDTEPAVDNWSYSDEERGNVDLNLVERREIELRTNFFNEKMSFLFAELISSPEVYLYFETENGFKWTPVNVTDSTIEVDTIKNKKLISKSVKVSLANNDSING